GITLLRGAGSDLRAHQASYEGADDTQQQDSPNPDIDDSREIEALPAGRKGEEQADAVDVGEVQEEVRDQRHHGRGECAPPANRLAGDSANQYHGQKSHHRHGHQRMREMSMIMQVVEGSSESGKDVDIGSIGG